MSGGISSDDFKVDRFVNFETPNQRSLRFTEVENSESRITLGSYFNSKINNKFTFRTGFVIENFTSENLRSDREKQQDLDGDGNPDLVTLVNGDENIVISQSYIQTQYRLSEKLTLNAGLHSQYTSLNDQSVLEPRVALNYAVSKRGKINIGYGLHHQSLPLLLLLLLLFTNKQINGQSVQTNKDLDFVRSNHFVVGYETGFLENWKAKIELYYQEIDNAAVEPFPSSYSSLTEGADFGFESDRVSLVNDGTGSNQGLELTIEHYFNKGFYTLLSASFFESKYSGSDGIERNSPFNNEYVVNLLAGKEWAVAKSNKNKFFVDTRLSTSGGRFFTPVDLQAS